LLILAESSISASRIGLDRLSTFSKEGGERMSWVFISTHGGNMDLSRRDFFNLSAGAVTGTALGGIAGLGVSLAPTFARAQELRIKRAKATPSVCPYCSVGCATLVHTVEGKIVNIEGDPRSPHSEGALCPKGAAIYQLHINPNRATKVLHRAPAPPSGRYGISAAPWTGWRNS